MTGVTTPCRVWRGATNNMGYGVLRRGGRAWLLHRWIMRLAGEEIDGKVVMHLCDNPPCFRFDHLRVGSHRDNTQDMVRKGRARGNANPSPDRKLTGEQVRFVRTSSRSARSLAREFGVTHRVIADIRNNNTYKDID